jgi:putative ABC transport system permease protein
MIKNYFKIALRNFKQHKLFTLINVIGLSIGISTALVIFLIVRYDLTFDKFHKDSDRIYRVVTNFSYAGEAGYTGGVTGPLPDAVENEVTGLTQSAPIFTNNFNVLIKEGNKTPQRFKNDGGIVFTDGRYFDIFQYKWLLGSPKNSLNEPNQVVLTSLQAKKYFPHLSYGQMLGRQVIYEDTIKTTVTGVVQEFGENSDLTFTAFVSRETMKTIKDLKRELEGWGGTTSNSQFFVKLAQGKAPANIEKQMNALLKKYNPPKPENKGSTQDFHLQPLSDLHFNEKYYAFDHPVASKSTIFGLIAIAGFILILGCINFINLTTAQGSRRAKEIGIRKTMGATRGQLITMFLSETFLVTLFAVIISVGLCPLALKLFSDFIAKGVKFDLLHQPGLIIFLLLLTIVVSFLSGFYPGMVLSGYKPALVIKNQAFNGKSKTRNAWLRKSLTVTQFIIAQFFIMATVIVSKQIYFALHKDLGFKKDAIGYIWTPWKVKSKALKQVFFNKIKALPQVELTSIGGDVPSSDGWSSNTVTYIDGKKEIKTELQIKSGDENYTRVYHIKLLTGRNVRMSDSSTSMMINNNYAHVLGFKKVNDALGKYVSFGEKEKRQIVGVVADFHQGSLHAPIKPLAIFPQTWGIGIHIALKPETPGGGEWKKAIASMQASWKELFPDDDFEFHFFDENIAKFYDKEQHFSTLLTWATGLSIFISCLGLLGLAIYTTNQRTKEIGVRKVLGASVTQIVTLLSSELIWLILLAFVLVTPIAWYAMNKWMESFADRTTISWWIFAISGAGMLIAAVFTSSFQTVKAAIANPVKSLRSE